MMPIVRNAPISAADAPSAIHCAVCASSNALLGFAPDFCAPIHFAAAHTDSVGGVALTPH